MTTPETYADLGEAGWRWVLDQVRWDDGPWIPESVAPGGDDGAGGPPDDRDNMHSGIGGLAHVLAEIREARPWTDEETALADGIATRIRRDLGGRSHYTYFDGLVSDLGVLSALGSDGADGVVARLVELRQDDGWDQPFLGPDAPEHSRINDMTLGTAGIVLGAVWAHRLGTPGAAELARTAADILLAEGEPTEAGTNWYFVPRRFTVDQPPARRERQMPNWSHGLAGIAGALAIAGAELGRPDLVEAARRGAEHLVTMGDTSGGGFRLPHVLPGQPDMDEFTYTWCHGPSGTSLAFTALEHAGIEEVAGESPAQWQRRCLHSVRTSGIPERLHPGFWDNDGRCCGTAGAGDVFLDAWQRRGVEDDLAFAQVLGDAIVSRALVDGDRATWRFTEHRNEDPLLPPGVGWMQGVAGISAYLLRLARVLRGGRTTPAVARLDTWWNLPLSPA
ncbi:hypothetical protein J2X46_000348 [Nocardioides sp. BE266]|uniref:lanthionine synthetase LanC family protein n=1 Tax=Nocardioides sp. BE266 TaxID=2817725 RepID=UPI002865CD92|nr:lanthionine synthetase LanC family protein [Nocardioides sp. BE266]MDR7251376.1 hypothetical protein [Nocardioides sp. BE266]